MTEKSQRSENTPRPNASDNALRNLEMRPARAAAHGLGILSLACTLILLCIGGLVTSHGAGLAVPDWPNSFGYNMFALPLSEWLSSSGVFYEHSHRVWASIVGLLTIALAIALNVAEWRERRWLVWLGWFAVVLVIAQGILGGLRVIWTADWIGLPHACIAQVFFVLLGFICLATSSWWLRSAEVLKGYSLTPRWVGLVATVSGLIFLQLILGAAMRHAPMAYRGLAVPDFPLAYGQMWPSTSDAAMQRIEEFRLAAHLPPTTKAQIHIHMTHRIMAVIILLATLYCLDVIRREKNPPPLLRRGAWTWVGLILLQASLGIWTVLSNKAADVASAHVAIGALCLLLGCILAIMAARTRTVIEAQG